MFLALFVLFCLNPGSRYRYIQLGTVQNYSHHDDKMTTDCALKKTGGKTENVKEATH